MNLAKTAAAATVSAAIVLGTFAFFSPSIAQEKVPPRASASGPAAARQGWQLVWADEFDHEGLPDPAKWTYEVGFIRNQEKQFYTKARKENARVAGGVLIIEGRKEPYAIPASDAPTRQTQRKTAAYTAASITTQGKASWTYGRIEVRAKLPQGKGVWPAIWTLGTSIPKIGWPRCGEIDIMEFVGHTPDKIHGTVHWAGPDGKHKSQGHSLKAGKPWEDFHVYAIEWTAEKIDFYFDETKYFTYKVSQADLATGNAFRKDHYLILNLALGGSWGGAIDDAIFPQRFEIDYVRVYRPVESTLDSVRARICLAATREALRLEIEHADREIANYKKAASQPANQKEVPSLQRLIEREQERLAKLQSQVDLYAKMTPDQYVLPKPVILEVRQGDRPGNIGPVSPQWERWDLSQGLSVHRPITSEHSWLIYHAGMSRSGPFYRAIASATPIPQVKRLRLAAYPLLRSAYPFPEYYAYIEKLDQD
ncbi:MAG: glycoside hydrolase family 16 protein [Planctomycetaceae bacterium]|nr:glycoside hydrolase family 16 protein [Planctomycetaceae bacterium]